MSKRETSKVSAPEREKMSEKERVNGTEGESARERASQQVKGTARASKRASKETQKDKGREKERE